MKKYFFTRGFLFLGLFIGSLSQRGFRRGFKYSLPSEDSESPDQKVFAFPYGEPSRFLTRNSDEERREVEEVRPLCEEERKSQNIRELIQERTSNFIQTTNNLDLRKYNLIPRKVDVIKCVTREGGDESNAVCKPENCRERKVDIEVFGRLKNETGNIWEFIGTLSAIPVACECFVRWKPEKCSRSVDIFSDY